MNRSIVQCTMNSASPAPKKCRRHDDDDGASPPSIRSRSSSKLDRATLGQFIVQRKELISNATSITPIVRTGSRVDQTRQPIAPLDRDWLSESLRSKEEELEERAATTRESPPPVDAQPPSPSQNNSNNNDNKVTLKVVTWNIWFSDYFWKERLVATISETLAHNPDVVCFQEVTREVHNCMLQCSVLRESYEPTEERLPHGYDVSVWVKKGLCSCRCWWIPLESNYGRRGLCVDLELLTPHQVVPTKRARIVTVHLESNRDRASTRERQLHQLFSCIRSTPWNGSTRTNNNDSSTDLSILAGDFNIDSTYRENALVRSNGIDLWEVLQPNAIGYTMNSYQNKMMFYAYCQTKQVRYDRIVLVPDHGAKSRARPLTIQTLGDDPLDRKRNLWASDHSGLVAEFELCDGLVDVEEYRVRPTPPQPTDGYTTP